MTLYVDEKSEYSIIETAENICILRWNFQRNQHGKRIKINGRLCLLASDAIYWTENHIYVSVRMSIMPWLRKSG